MFPIRVLTSTEALQGIRSTVLCMFRPRPGAPNHFTSLVAPRSADCSLSTQAMTVANDAFLQIFPFSEEKGQPVGHTYQLDLPDPESRPDRVEISAAGRFLDCDFFEGESPAGTCRLVVSHVQEPFTELRQGADSEVPPGSWVPQLERGQDHITGVRIAAAAAETLLRPRSRASFESSGIVRFLRFVQPGHLVRMQEHRVGPYTVGIMDRCGEPVALTVTQAGAGRNML